MSEIAASLYLGQAYGSGRLYVEGVSPSILTEDRPGRLRSRGLDSAMLQNGVASGPFAAQILGIQMIINPQLIEGMLKIDSPGASDDFKPREGASYLDRENGPAWWDRRDFFATNETSYWGGVESIAPYDIDQQMQTSFRVLAYDEDLRIRQLDHSYAGTARPMTQQDSLDLSRERKREGDCTLEAQPFHRSVALPTGKEAPPL